MTDPRKAEKKYIRLTEALAAYPSLLVAYSGGADSSFLLATAAERVDGRVLAVTARSPLHPPHEEEAAETGARYLGVEHVFVKTDEMENPAFRLNPRERCYICKSGLMKRLVALAAEENLSAVAEGTTADEASGVRPGLRACRELSVESPLLDVGFTKADVRCLGRELGVPGWDAPPSGCLATRIPYDTELTVGLLERVSEAEALIRSLGVKQVRVRTYPDGLARVEVEPGDFQVVTESANARKIRDRLREIGYRYITLDLDGFRSGSMDS
ncbi:MAG: ATP-dependent sacrificial sulfur transferase LarE [Candidatus Coatesbacteria bacterium]|nr:MAG: ATP-dependent sacrificial sulfur transferase LarE [Candidatus Coatesbacteria bacterium]